jgi:hypothetical protein
MKKLFVTFLLIVIFAVPSTGLARNFYLDATNGDDNNLNLAPNSDDYTNYPGCYYFDGVDDYIQVTKNSTIDQKDKTTVTIIAWIYPTGIGAGNFGRVLDKGTASYGVFIQDEVGSTARLACVFYYTGASDSLTITNARVITYNQWNKIEIRHNEDADKKSNIYVNDVEITDLSTDQAGLLVLDDDSGADLYIGNRAAADRCWDGYICDLKIYMDGAQASYWPLAADALDDWGSNDGTASGAYKVVTHLSSTSGEGWQTFTPVESTTRGDKQSAEDIIIFKDDEIWRDELDPPISNVAYQRSGDGTNRPVISAFNEVTGFALVGGEYEVAEASTINTIIWDGVRLEEGTAGSLASGQWDYNGGKIYVKDNPSGHTVEASYRNHAIYINNINHIIIDGLDCRGSNGNYGSIRIEGTSQNITVSNSSLKWSSTFGISSANTCSNITYDGLTATYNESTGIYNNATNGIIRNCIAHDNGRFANDSGDRGGIGVNHAGISNTILIESNQIYQNGPDDEECDFEVSVINPASGTDTIRRNHIYNCIQGGVQIGGDNATSWIVNDNIIDNYGSCTDTPPATAVKYAGIRLGYATGACKSALIYNNVIANGQAANAYTSPAIGFYNNAAGTDFSNTKIKNNIIYGDNSKALWMPLAARMTETGMEITYNCSFAPGASYTNWWTRDGTAYSGLTAWTAASGYDATGSFSALDPLFVNPAGGDFTLTRKSPARNNGDSTVWAGTASITDYAGNPITDASGNIVCPGTVDIGAYEYQKQGETTKASRLTLGLH